MIYAHFQLACSVLALVCASAWAYLARDLLAGLFIRALVSWGTWRGRVRIIKRDDADSPYMIRYAVCGWLPQDGPRKRWLPNLYLHHIRLPDADPHMHNHPWNWACSLILKGWYLEEHLFEAAARGGHTWASKFRCFGAGMFNKIRGRSFHRIARVSDGGVWTLFATSQAHGKSWGFLVPGKGLVHWQEYLACSYADKSIRLAYAAARAHVQSIARPAPRHALIRPPAGK